MIVAVVGALFLGENVGPAKIAAVLSIGLGVMVMSLRGGADLADSGACGAGGADGSTSAAAGLIAPPAPGCRIVVDARALQDPDRAPTTAIYLEALLGAYAARPLPCRSSSCWWGALPETR